MQTAVVTVTTEVEAHEHWAQRPQINSSEAQFRDEVEIIFLFFLLFCSKNISQKKVAY